MSESAAVHDGIREQAAFWLIHFDSDDATDTEQIRHFQSWLAQDTRHRQVFEQMQRLWGAAAPLQSGKSHRFVLGAISFCLLALLTWQLPWTYWTADYRTIAGDVRAITLPDGSVATLNTNSAIDLEFSESFRRIKLIRGEVLVYVSKDPQRPLQITTPNATAEALGTIYSVKRNESSSRVSVFESRVKVSTPDGSHQQILAAGEAARVSTTGIQPVPTDPGTSPDWSRQRLVFENEPLPRVIARLQQYHPGLLKLTAEADHSARRFTGVLPSNDSGEAISLLAGSMNLQVKRFTPYVILLSSVQAPDHSLHQTP